MRIGVNFSYKLIASRGIARFTENILANLPANENDFFFFVPVGCSFTMNFKFSNRINYIHINTSNYFVYEHIKLPNYIRKYKIDILLNPANTVPIIKNTKWVSVIHDVIPFKLKTKPFTKKWLVNIYMRFLMKKSIKKSSNVITVSEYSKKDIESLNIKHKLITVVYNGFNHQNNLETIIKNQIDLPEHYIFWLGGDGYNKNINAIIKLLDSKKIDFKFVIGGVKRRENIEQLEKLGAKVFVNVSDAELAIIYRHADVFLFPSYYEGFGIPILEAMFYGVPYILSSNATSLPEVCGDSCYLFEPDDINGIESYIEEIRLGKLQRKDDTYKVQLLKFNWKTEAKKLYGIIENVL